MPRCFCACRVLRFCSHWRRSEPVANVETRRFGRAFSRATFLSSFDFRSESLLQPSMAANVHIQACRRQTITVTVHDVIGLTQCLLMLSRMNHCVYVSMHVHILREWSITNPKNFVRLYRRSRCSAMEIGSNVCRKDTLPRSFYFGSVMVCVLSESKGSKPILAAWSKIENSIARLIVGQLILVLLVLLAKTVGYSR